MVTGNTSVMFVTPLIADKVGAAVVTATRVTLIILEVSLTKRTLHILWANVWMVLAWYIGNHTAILLSLLAFAS